MPKYKIPTRAEYDELLKEYHSAESDAERKFFLDKIVRGVYGLAIKFGTNYCYGRNPQLTEDAIQACLAGIIKAANRFEAGKGASFSTWAVFWMRAELNKLNHDNPLGAICVNNDARRAAIKRLQADTPKDDDYKILNHTMSWDELNDNTEDNFTGDATLYNNSIYTPSTTEAELIHKDLYLKVEKVMESVLNEKERMILRGLSNSETLQSLGEKLGYSRERIRQISAQALGKVRKKANSLGLT